MTQWAENVAALVQFVVQFVIAATTDFVRSSLSLGGALALVVGFCLIRLANFWLLQRGARRDLANCKPGQPSEAWWRREARTSLLVQGSVVGVSLLLLPLTILVGIFLLLRKLWRVFKKWRESRKQGEAGPPTPTPQEAPFGVLVAAIAPSLVDGAFAAWLMWLLCLLVDLVLTARFGLGAGAAGLEFAMLGNLGWLAWLSPLERHPATHLLVSGLVWTTVWWWSARLVRLANSAELGVNLYRAPDVFEGLPRWQRWYAARHVWEPHQSFRVWAKWLALGTLPLLLLACLALDPSPYALAPAPFVLAWCTWTSLGLWLLMRGLYQPVPLPAAQEKPPTERKGWLDVRADLEARWRVTFPRDEGEHLAVSRNLRLELSDASLPMDDWLAGELLGSLQTAAGDVAGNNRGLTPLQLRVLQAINEARPPELRKSLATGSALRLQAAQTDATTGLDLRAMCCIAPAGAGKSTAALLAACDVAIVEGRSTIAVFRTAADARAWRDRLQALLSGTSARWNLTSALMGDDFVRKVTDDEIPDVLAIGLDELMTDLLQNRQTNGHRRFLQRVGLVLVDDLEAFCGASEQHLQLALRRLWHALVSCGAAAGAGGDRSNVALVAFAQPSSLDIDKWARSVLSRDQLDVRTFSAGTVASQPASAPLVRIALTQLRQPDGKALAWQHVIASCEQLAVPWTFIVAGDDQRRIGASAIGLAQDPQHFRADPCDAAVVLVDGNWAAVQRELDLLVAAGRRFSCFRHPAAGGGEQPVFPAAGDGDNLAKNTVAVLSLVDGDEQMAFAERDDHSSLSAVLQRLPRPLPRAPEGDIAQAHLAAELCSPLEVKHALDMFGADATTVLLSLVESGSATAYAYRDVYQRSNDHEAKVDLRIDQSAIPTENTLREAEAGIAKEMETLFAKRTRLATLPLSTESAGEQLQAIDQHIRELRARLRRPLLIPPLPVSCEVGAFGAVRYVDAATSQEVATADVHSAFLSHYPGRVFMRPSGRFTVVYRGARELDHQAAGLRPGDQVVAPFMDTLDTSPRRRVFCSFDPREQHRAWTRRAEAWGRCPLEITRGTAEITIRHIATVTFNALYGLVTRRTILTELEQQRYETQSIRQTRALMIHPCGAASQWAPVAAPLTLGGARLVAAALRMALPSLFRGVQHSCAIGVVAGPQPAAGGFGSGPVPTVAADYELGPADGIVLFDLQEGAGNLMGSIERDGIEVLLRMARRVIERVLYHQRLLVRYDEWGDATEILNLYEDTEQMMRAEQAMMAELNSPRSAGDGKVPVLADENSGSEAPVVEVDEAAVGRRARDAAVRSLALQWLDDVLLPEGWTPIADAARNFGSDYETGEGDRFDLGRIWHSESGSVANLVWSKHRFVLAPGTEAAFDAGLDSSTAVRAANWLQPHAAGDPEFQCLGESLHKLYGTWHAIMGPTPVYSVKHGDEVTSSKVTLSQERVVTWLAPVAWSWRRVAPFARFLRRTWQKSDPPPVVQVPPGRNADHAHCLRMGALAGLVQAMTNDPRRSGLDIAVAAPLHTFTARTGGALDKALLLATLAWRAGMQAGVFVRTRADKRVHLDALAGIGIGEVPTGDPQQQGIAGWTVAEAWRKRAGLDNPVPFWSVARGMTLVGAPQGVGQVFIPIDVTADVPVGSAFAGDPENWEFLPLSLVLKYFEVPGRLRVPVTVPEPTPDPDAPPPEDDDTLARREITEEQLVNPPALGDGGRKVSPLPLDFDGKTLVRKWSFEDRNDGQRHTVEFRLDFEQVRTAVGQHGVPESFLQLRYPADQADEYKRRWRQVLRARGLDVQDSLHADWKLMAEADSTALMPVVEALRAAAPSKSGPRAWAGLVAAFVQSIPYHVPKSLEIAPGFYFGECLPPLETLARGWGDCDTKSVLFAALLRCSGGPSAVLVLVPSHMFAGAGVVARSGDCAVSLSNQNYSLVEVTSPFPLGKVGDEYEGLDGSGAHGEEFLVVSQS